MADPTKCSALRVLVGRATPSIFPLDFTRGLEDLEKAQGRESLDFARDREPVERALERCARQQGVHFRLRTQKRPHPPVQTQNNHSFYRELHMGTSKSRGISASPSLAQGERLIELQIFLC
jgi:hypothetical protein